MLNSLSSPSVHQRVLKRRKRVRVRGIERWHAYVLKIEKGPETKEFSWPLEAGKSREMDSPLKLPKGTQAYLHLDFSLAKPIWGFWSKYVLVKSLSLW